MQTSGDLLITLLFYFALTISSLGWGKIAAGFLGASKSEGLDNFNVIWLGWCGILFVLQFFHYFVPLNIYSCSGVYGVGLLASICFPRFKADWLKKISLKRNRIFYLGVIMLSMWTAWISMRTVQDYDSGLYHFNAIRWINEYAIVPGLGNLHDRLAFNYSYFPFVASLNFYPYFNHGHNIATGWLWLLAISGCLHCFLEVFKNLQRNENSSAHDLVSALLFPYLIYLSSDMEFSSPQADRASILVRFVLFVYLWRNLTAADRVKRLFYCKLLFILGTTAITLKSSNLVFAGTVCAAAVLRCYGGESCEIVSLLLRLRRSIVWAFLILVVWAGRGIITSGYPLFPSTLGGVHSDWAVPASAANRCAEWIYSWARRPYLEPQLVLGNWDWILPWSTNIWRNQKHEIVIPCIIFLGISLLIPVLIGRCQRYKAFLSKPYLVIVPPLAGICFWFCLAPDPRFVVGLFWLLPLAALCLLIEDVAPSSRKKWIMIGFAIMTLPLILGGRRVLREDFDFSTVGWKPIPKVRLNEMITDQGLKVFVPAQPDQGWDSPLPGTPYFNRSLELRGRGLQSGFKTAAPDHLQY